MTWHNSCKVWPNACHTISGQKLPADIIIAVFFLLLLFCANISWKRKIKAKFQVCEDQWSLGDKKALVCADEHVWCIQVTVERMSALVLSLAFPWPAGFSPYNMKYFKATWSFTLSPCWYCLGRGQKMDALGTSLPRKHQKTCLHVQGSVLGV